MDYATIPGQWIEFQKSQVASINSLREALFSAVEKAFQLNAAAAKALLGDGIEATQVLVGAKSAQDAFSLWNGIPAWTLEKISGYSQNAYGVLSGAGTEVLKLVEAQLAQVKRQMSELTDLVNENGARAPAPAVSLFKGLMSATQTAIDGELKLFKQVVEWGGLGAAALAKAAATMSAARPPDQSKVAASAASNLGSLK